MEDASAIDLDWFWRGWFYDIEPVDISLDSVKAITLINNREVPVKMDTVRSRANTDEFEHISKKRNRESGMQFLVDADTSLRDFYYFYKPNPNETKNKTVVNRYQNLESISDSSFTKEGMKDKFIYELSFTNKGGLVMPIIIKWNYKDGTSEIDRINAYVWRKNEKNVVKTFAKTKEVASVLIDPFKETADIDEKNNTWNTSSAPSRFDVFKSKSVGRGQSTGGNPMQKGKK
jgi:hypothetical protein